MSLQKPPLWREIQRTNFTQWQFFADFLELDPGTLQEAFIPPKHFPLNVPRRLAEKIQKGNWQDPILRQFLPTAQEQVQVEQFNCDPVGDKKSRKGPKLLHKYHGRALLLASSACAMHCRYCFRQHFDYATEEKGFETELKQIEQETSLKEIILSGGDPLSLSNRELSHLIDRLSAIQHIKWLRFHTRFPMGIPERIDPEFLNILAASRLQTIFLIHSNHPNEWDDEIQSALKQVQKLGIPILCQTVLLKGVNDDVQTLKALCERLIDAGIIPYYLHQLDRVAGAMHFEVEEEKGIKLIEELRAVLPGYGVPRYVREIAGENSKTPLHPIQSL